MEPPPGHDHFFRALMERPKAAGALLREQLPKAFAERLVGDPVLVEGSFMDDGLRGSQSDRLFRAELRGIGEAFVYCLVEHKSAPDPRVALQLLRYLVRIWERLEHEAKGKGLLAPVFPLVVYHGKPAWRSPARFSGMVSAAEELRPHLLDFPFGLLDVGQVEDPQLSEEPQLRAGLVVLKYSMRVTAEGVEEAVHEVLPWMRGVPDDLFRLVVRYMIHSYGRVGRERFESAMKAFMSEREREMYSQVERELLAEGEARGEAKALVRVLERRFGPVAADIQRRIGEAEKAQLESWLDRAVDARTLDAVFEEPAAH
jgi:predicted transposase YdaD